MRIGGNKLIWDTKTDKESAAYRFASDDSKVIRVVAGPGTGKSFGLKRRVARLLEEGQDPKRILAVTFTRTAANDLKNEISSIGIDGADRVVAKTLHGFCFGLLRKREIIENTGRVPRPMLEFEQKPMLYDISKDFGGIKEKETKLKAFEAAWARLQSEEPGFPHNDEDRAFQEEVLSWLKAHKSMLFGEIIIETYHYLRNNPMCFELRSFDHVLVDEYQDLNKAEQKVIDQLSENGYLTAIGDDDQSIYSFKYANPEGIREFPNTHNNCNVIDFDFCRRCPKQVVYMASRLISHNRNRTLGDLHAFEDNQNGIVKIVQWANINDEIEGISRMIKRDINSGMINPEDVLVLTPARRIGYRIRDTLVKEGVNAKSYFRESVLESDINKERFSLLSLLADPDDMVSLRYLLGAGSANYCAPSYKRLRTYSENHGISIIEALEQCLTGKIQIPYTSSLVKKYDKIKNDLNTIKSAAEKSELSFFKALAEGIPESDDFNDLLAEAGKEADIDREQDTDSWIRDIHTHMLEKVSYPDDISDNNHVRIMSLHASKGLSAKYVIITSAVEGLIPRVNNDERIKNDNIEEQRRLFYVAVTRCKSSKDDFPGELIISSFIGIPRQDALILGMNAKSRANNEVIASRFIQEFEDTAPTPIKAT